MVRVGEGDEYDGDSEGSSDTEVGCESLGHGGGVDKGKVCLEDEVGELTRLEREWSVR